jgi:hypothetical protein
MLVLRWPRCARVCLSYLDSLRGDECDAPDMLGDPAPSSFLCVVKALSQATMALWPARRKGQAVVLKLCGSRPMSSHVIKNGAGLAFD